MRSSVFHTFMLISGMFCLGELKATDIPKDIMSGNLRYNQRVSGNNSKKTEIKLDDPRWTFVPAEVAVIGDKKITKEEFLREINALIPPNAPPIPPGELPVMARKTVDRLLNKIIFTNLVNSAGIHPGSDLVKDEFRGMVRNYSDENFTNLTLKLREQGMSLESYENLISQDENIQLGIAISKWIETVIAPQVEIKDSDIERYYREHQSEFRIPESVKVFHILVKVDLSGIDNDGADSKSLGPENIDSASKKDEAKAEKIAQAERAALEKIELMRARIMQGEDFGRIAEEFSDCPISRSKRGELGELPVGEKRMLPEFEAVISTLKKGELSKPIRTKYGYHIVKYTERTPASYKPIEKVDASIKEDLKNKRMYEILQKYMEKEKTKLNVKINL